MPKKLMIQDYFDNVKHYENKYGKKTILLWQCGSFFEVYGMKDNEGNIIGSNIIEFSKILEIIIAEKKSYIKYNGERKKVVMAGNGTVVPLEKYIPKLNNAGYTVVVWNEVGDDHINGGKERKEFGVFSVGTNFDIQTKEITNNIACIWIESFKKSIIQNLPRIFFGCSTIDIYTGKVTLFQYKYEANKLHEPCVFDELERFMSIYNPREIILIHNYEDDKKVKELLQFIEYPDIKLHNINLNEKCDKTIQALKCEKQIWQQEILKKFYKMNDFNVFFDSCRLKEYSWATQSFIYLLNFVEKHNNNLVENLNYPEYDKTDDKVFLATHSLKQLNIISQNQKSKLSSLEKFLNNCYTNMGKRLFRYHILHPNFDEKYLMKEYEIIDYILNNYESLEIIRKQLHSIKDIEKLERKIILNKINPCEIVEIYSNTKTLIKIMNIIENNDILNNYVTEKICNDFIETCNKVTHFLEKYINFEKAINIIKIKEPDNFFKRNIFKHLDTIHREHIENEQKLSAIQIYLSSILEKNEKKKGKSLIKKHQTPKSGLWLQATSKRSEILKITLNQLQKKNIKLSYKSNYDQSVKEFDVSLENFKCVTTSQNNKKLQSITLNELYDSILQSSHILFEIIEQSYNQFIKEFKNYSKELNTIIKFTGLVDFIMTKSYNAREYNYCKPVIDGNAEKSYFDAKSIRHPLIEHINCDELYKPNDISLGNNIDGTLLYGTNAVGKSSLIKSMGMAVIMAQAGMYVPCNSFTYKPYKIISTRILGNDNFFKGLSSFAVEMSELKTILNIADENTLILGDELCSGTEIKSALSIFAASLITLSERKSSFIFATHLHELQRLDKIKSIGTMNMKHMRVEYNAEKDKLIYMRDLRDGPGNNMYGLEVCKSLGLDDVFIELANDIRYNLFPSERTLLENNQSKYNAKKIKNNCEFCDNPGEEVHHLNPQELADNLGNIFHFKKNHKANLVNICKECHTKITKKKIVHCITKTSCGYELIEQ
jgi:DNA mismatch repair protein MutS